MKVSIALVFALAAVVVRGQEKCSGNPRTYNGKPCASTTVYIDAHKGACGCGPEGSDNQFDFNRDKNVAAADQKFFDGGGGTWCGSACGRCIKLTSTGGYVAGQGGAVSEGTSKIFRVTNLCPDVEPNKAWCNQASNGGTNNYGYQAHFDLENGGNQISDWSNKNPEVTYEETGCGGNAPSDGEYSQCQCG